MSKLNLHAPSDVEISHLQQRIYLHRIALQLSIETAKQALHERLSSPGMLVAAGATGFVLERVTRRQPARPGSGPEPSVAKRGFSVVTEAARTALRFMQSGPGLWLATRFAQRAARESAEDRSPQSSVSY